VQDGVVVCGHRSATQRLALACGVFAAVAACKHDGGTGTDADANALASDVAQPGVDSEAETAGFNLCDCTDAGACPDPTNFEHSNCEYMPAVLGQGIVWRIRYGDDCWGLEEASGDLFVAVFYRGKDKMDSSFVAKAWRNIPAAQGPLSLIGTGSGACGAPCGTAEVSREFVCGYHD
jgi:hypothetical protein